MSARSPRLVRWIGLRGLAGLLSIVLAAGAVSAQPPAMSPAAPGPPGPPSPRIIEPPPQPSTRAPEPPPVEKLGEDRLRVGTIHIDLKRREITVPGTVNGAMVLEFVANTKGGFKAYESALTLDTNAVTFNLALILIGCDKARSVPPQRHFDPTPPKGDPLEIWVAWRDEAATRRIRAEELVFDARKREPLPQAAWVYTGSVFLRDGRYLADAHGVLIGFVHTPAPIIEYQPSDGVAAFGSFQLNQTLGLKPGTPVQVIVRALGPP